MEVHGIPFLGQILTVLIAAGVLVPLFNRLRISPVLGYLAAGFLVGPFGVIAWMETPPVWLSFLSITHVSDVAHLAEFGIVFLMFMIGLELSPQRLWAMRKLVFGLGALQVSCSIAALASACYFLLKMDMVTSLVIGGALALSSTAIVMQILADKHLVSTPMGRGAFSILLFQDIAVVPILIAIGLAGIGGETGGVVEAVGLALVKAVVAILLLLLVGHFLLRPVFRLAGSAKGAEPFMAVTLLTVIAASAVTGEAGLSMALGAFVGGLLLAETEYRHAIEVYIEPFKGLLLGVFFMSVGMAIDPHLVRLDAQWIALSVLGVIAVKATIIAVLGRFFGMIRGDAVEAGFLLSQGGEFAFVIVGAATTAGLIGAEAAQFLLLVAGLSMVVTPLLSFVGQRLGQKLDARHLPTPAQDMAEEIPHMRNHVIIAGFGRVGKAVGMILEAEAVPYLAVEPNAQIVEDHHGTNLPVIYGNALNGNFLVHCHPESAQAVLITMADEQIAAHIIKNIRHHWPDLPIYTRARDLKAARKLKKAGSSVVVAETIEASMQLASSLLLGLGSEEEVVRRRMELTREYALNRIREEV